MGYTCYTLYKTPLLWITLSLLAVTENGETLLSDPLLDMPSSSSSLSLSSGSSNLEGATAEARAAGGCHFPEGFRGSWFQSGVHHAITISRNAISTKGRCLEKDGEKYLVYYERDSCYRCLVFNEKHLNVLQYKETFCIPERRSLRNICSTITGDAYLFAMFRLDAVPIDCPFKGQFTVSYNRGHGECRYPVSTLESCTKSSRLVFNYQACPDIYGTESSVEELQCLASWKEGSSRYFLGLMQYQHHASYEERFRCFVYESSKSTRGDTSISSGISSFGHLGNPSHNSHSTSKFHTSGGSSSHGGHFLIHNGGGGNNSSASSDQIYRVAQSGDATCNGLSSMEGSRTMTLRRAPTAKPCQFPSWIQTHSQWHTLDQGSTYSFHSGNLQISNFSELAGTGPNSLAMNAMCYQVLEDNNSYSNSQNRDNPSVGGSDGGGGRRRKSKKTSALIVLHATAECKSGYICTVFYKRDRNIMEIQFGTMARRAEDACHVSHFNPTLQPYVTLVSSTPARSQCPNLGPFQVTGTAWSGRKVIESCNQDDNGDVDGSGGGSSGNSLSVGCSSSDSMQIRVHSPCEEPTHFYADYNCHGWWTESGITYVLTTRSASHQSFRPQRHCFAFRDLSWTRRASNRPRLPFHSRQRSSSDPDGLHSQEDSFTTVDVDDDDDDHEEDDGLDDGQQDPSSSHNNNNSNGKLLEFSSFADSCRRNVVFGLEGDFAFNLTRIGQCSDVNTASPGLWYRGRNSHGYFVQLVIVAINLFAAKSVMMIGSGSV